MRKNPKIKQIARILATIAFICLCVVIGYEFYVLRERGQFGNDFPSFVTDPNSSIYYEINPETILMSLDRGETEIFHSVVGTPEFGSPIVSGSFPWSQPEYVKIATAFSKIKWQEDLNDWYIFGMFFEKQCSDNPKGFDSGSIIYFKAYTHNGTSDYFRYQTATIAIYPLFKSVVFGGDVFPRPLFGWQSLTISSFRITADDALKIAEEKGGEDARLKVNNVCNITVINTPYPRENNYWRVRYSPASFEIQIDPYTGKYKILNTDQ